MDYLKIEKEIKLYYEKKRNLSKNQLKSILLKFKTKREELFISIKNNYIDINEINDKNAQYNVISEIEKIMEKLKDKKLVSMITDLEEKVKDINDDDNEENNNSNNEIDSNKLLTQLTIKNIEKNSEALKIRREKLNDIQILAGQIKDLTNDMKIKINENDEAFKNMEDKVILIDNNVSNGFQNIKEIQKRVKENKKKICCIVFLIIFVVGIICVVIFALYSDFFKFILD